MFHFRECSTFGVYPSITSFSIEFFAKGVKQCDESPASRLKGIFVADISSQWHCMAHLAFLNGDGQVPPPPAGADGVECG